jgi:hypothetical protein
MTGRPAVPELMTVAEPHTYIDGRTFDWIAYRLGRDGERIWGGVGVCGIFAHAIERVEEELADYLTTAYATITVTFHLREPERKAIAHAMRNEAGKVSWSFPT